MNFYPSHARAARIQQGRPEAAGLNLGPPHLFCFMEAVAPRAATAPRPASRGPSRSTDAIDGSSDSLAPLQPLARLGECSADIREGISTTKGNQHNVDNRLPRSLGAE